MQGNTILHVKIEIPDISGKSFNGILTLSEKHNYVEFSELPYGPLSFKTIPLIYCFTKKESFTLIQCIFSKSNNNQVTYIINELYDAIIDDNYDKAEFTGLSAYITDFKNWVEPKLINYSHSEIKEQFITIEL